MQRNQIARNISDPPTPTPRGRPGPARLAPAVLWLCTGLACRGEANDGAQSEPTAKQRESPKAQASADVETTPEPVDREKLAREQLQAVNKLVGKHDYVAAKQKIDELEATFGDTKIYRKRGARLAAEIRVIGRDAPEFAVEKWFREADVDLKSDQPTVLVFFEQWCPHCRKEVPKLEQTFAKHKDKGLHLVGLTKMTRNATDEQVHAVIEKTSYPVAKEDGSLSRAFAVAGIPAAAVVKGGKIVWRGHPARIDDEMIDAWLASS